jgi:hypothetical protein
MTVQTAVAPFSAVTVYSTGVQAVALKKLWPTPDSGETLTPLVARAGVKGVVLYASGGIVTSTVRFAVLMLTVPSTPSRLKPVMSLAELGPPPEGLEQPLETRAKSPANAAQSVSFVYQFFIMFYASFIK